MPWKDKAQWPLEFHMKATIFITAASWETRWSIKSREPPENRETVKHKKLSDPFQGGIYALLPSSTTILCALWTPFSGYLNRFTFVKTPNDRLSIAYPVVNSYTTHRCNVSDLTQTAIFSSDISEREINKAKKYWKYLAICSFPISCNAFPMTPPS